MDYNNNYRNNGVYGNPNYGGGRPGQGYAIASMVCGILSIVFCWCGGITGVVLGIIAIAMHDISKRESRGNPGGMAKAGLVCGIIGLSLGAAYFVLILFDVGFGIASLI